MAPVYWMAISELEPDDGWTLLEGHQHATVWHRARGLLFDPQFEALGIGADETFQLATGGKPQKHRGVSAEFCRDALAETRDAENEQTAESAGASSE